MKHFLQHRKSSSTPKAKLKDPSLLGNQYKNDSKQNKKVALFSHKKQGNKFPKDRVMIAAKTKPKLWRNSEFIFDF